MNHSMFSIADNIQNVRQVIKKAELAARRKTGSVQLLAVSKKQSAENIKRALDAGQFSFGENYVSEAVDKQDALQGLLSSGNRDALEWHYIGPVQSNKTRTIAERFAWVQSIDRLKIATRLNAQRPEDAPPLNVCIQVNIDQEESKAGVDLEQVPAMAAELAKLERLRLRGLMAIPKAGQTAEQREYSFEAMAKAYHDLKQDYASVDTLSMGMSGDFEQAIRHGSTMVRIGTALFGERN